MKNYCTCTQPDQLCAYCRQGEAQGDAIETRAFQIRDCLIKKGRDGDYAERVGLRFAALEMNKAINWD
jgi:hypothetical protein